MVTTYLVSARPTSRYVGTCRPCGRPVAGIAETGESRASIICPDCHAQVKGERVYGTVSAMDCNAACMGAAGPVCECACGGANHCGAWSQAGEMLAGELEAYRAREARKSAERERRATVERTARQREFDRWREANADLAAFLATAGDGEPGPVPLPAFLADMAELAAGGKPLSERQSETAARVMAEHQARAAQRAAETAHTRPVPTGKAIQITGEVIHTRLDDSPFGYGYCVSKMLVRGDGWKVWATIPASIDDINATAPGNIGGLRGKVVRFTADVAASRDDASFGYAKRPRRAEILTAVTA